MCVDGPEARVLPKKRWHRSVAEYRSDALVKASVCGLGVAGVNLGYAVSVCDSESRVEIAGRLTDEFAAEVCREYVWLNAGGCYRRVPRLELAEGAAVLAKDKEVLAVRVVLGEM